MKRYAWACVVLAGGVLGLGPGEAAAGEAIPLVVDAPLPPPAEQALGDLERVLRARGVDAARQKSLPAEGPAPLVVGTAGASAAVDRLLNAHRIGLPKEAESLCI